MTDFNIESIILESTNAKEVLAIDEIQSLWSGYGSLNRVTLDSGPVILKLIKFPEINNHPRGWSSDFAHKRKEKSYHVEMNWYEKFNDEVKNAYSPRLINKGKIPGGRFIILEDLGPDIKTDINFDKIKKCLKWLAHFHKYYLGKNQKGLWEMGTYWHLETRPQELEVMDDLELKAAASQIDRRLNEARFKTIIHGDTKLANFIFGNRCSAVDFQYVGGGVGIKDVAYFLSSVYDEDELEMNESKCLEYYFKELDNQDVEREWRELYSYAWCDFFRFLAGWAPGHYKINSYSKKMKDKVLNELR